MRGYFAIVEADDAATVGLPDGFMAFTGKGTLPPLLPPTSNRVTVLLYPPGAAPQSLFVRVHAVLFD